MKPTLCFFFFCSNPFFFFFPLTLAHARARRRGPITIKFKLQAFLNNLRFPFFKNLLPNENKQLLHFQYTERLKAGNVIGKSFFSYTNIQYQYIRVLFMKSLYFNGVTLVNTVWKKFKRVSKWTVMRSNALGAFVVFVKSWIFILNWKYRRIYVWLVDKDWKRIYSVSIVFNNKGCFTCLLYTLFNKTWIFARSFVQDSLADPFWTFCWLSPFVDDH